MFGLPKRIATASQGRAAERYRDGVGSSYGYRKAQDGRFRSPATVRLCVNTYQAPAAGYSMPLRRGRGKHPEFCRAGTLMTIVKVHVERGRSDSPETEGALVRQ